MFLTKHSVHNSIPTLPSASVTNNDLPCTVGKATLLSAVSPKTVYKPLTGAGGCRLCVAQSL